MEDFPPKKITLAEWSAQFRKIPDSLIKNFYYYGNPDWGRYLSPPATFMVYGARELSKLKFDNSISCLRLWGFVFNESERLFRAQQIGKKVIATMGDLGIIPIIVSAFPESVPFYPECFWWTPFYNESNVLFDQAGELGVPEASCFSKAVVSAFYKKAYFPRPHLIIASTGASCDDYSCIMQIIADFDCQPFWVEIPLRRKGKEEKFVEYLTTEYYRVWQKLEEIFGKNEISTLTETIKRMNRLRKMVKELQEMVHTAPIAPLPALEMMVIEFGNLDGYGNFGEWEKIVADVLKTVEKRVKEKVGVLKEEAIPIAWVTPSADPILLNLMEDLGCRVVATEYLINQASVLIEEGEPFSSLARAFLSASLIGQTKERVGRIKEEIKKGKVRGVLITNVLGASHCALETRLIEAELKDVPVLAIDVPKPKGITEAIKNRLWAFIETIR
uniref:2-hydroxyacyl-CoA dehydratase n=1 Tax=candidate division WOR-3 bacterium TaxID=2052148 RepID=A0A7C3Z3D0_UNCW3